MNNSYRLLKLKSGEEIITRIKRVRNDTIVIERPMKLESSFTMDTHGNAKEIIILKKWLRYTPQKQTSIPRDFVASFIKPNNDIMELYAIEKKKDDMDNSKKSKIIKPNNIQPKRDNYNKYNDIDYSEVNELMDFVNNNSDKMTPEHIKNIIDEMDKLSDEEMDELMGESPNPEEFKKMITLNMMIPPEALMIFVENGMIDIEDVKELIDGLNDKPQTPKNPFNYLWYEPTEPRDPDEYGNSWRDWSSNPDDYTNFDDNPDGL